MHETLSLGRSQTQQKALAVLKAVAILVFGAIIFCATYVSIASLPTVYSVLFPEADVPDAIQKFAESPESKQVLSWILAGFGAAAARILEYLFGKGTDSNATIDTTSKVVPSKDGSRVQIVRITQAEYIASLKAQLERWKSATTKQKEFIVDQGRKLYNAERFAATHFMLATVLYVSVAYAFAHPFAAGMQAIVQGAIPFDAVGEPARFCVLYSQSLTLALGAFTIPALFYSMYIKRVKQRDFNSIVAIGSGGVFIVGFVGFVQLSPEQYVLIISSDGMSNLPYFDVPLLLFLAVSRLLVFPALGLCGTAVVALVQPRALHPVSEVAAGGGN
jgi:hypothetical protein